MLELFGCLLVILGGIEQVQSLDNPEGASGLRISLGEGCQPGQLFAVHSALRRHEEMPVQEQILLVVGFLLFLLPDFVQRISQYLLHMELVNDLFRIGEVFADTGQVPRLAKANCKSEYPARIGKSDPR